MDKLTELAGVGRKTANVVRGEVWGLADGITVDTHVKRITNLIGLVKSEDPIKIEQELMKIVPKKILDSILSLFNFTWKSNLYCKKTTV